MRLEYNCICLGNRIVWDKGIRFNGTDWIGQGRISPEKILEPLWDRVGTDSRPGSKVFNLQLDHPPSSLRSGTLVRLVIVNLELQAPGSTL